MRYLRLFSVLFLSTFVITGCHHKPPQAAPPLQAQAPIVTTLPPIPPLTFPDVQIAKPAPPPPVMQTVAATPPPKKHPKHVHHYHAVHKADAEVASSEPSSAAPPAAAPANGASVLGQLSADDATADPHLNVQTGHLIEQTEDRLKKISRPQRARHKEAIAQVQSFLSQAKQARAMNDVVGATTLVNKAKILLDELLK